MYKHFFKPLFDFLLSLLAIIILSPFFLLFTPIVAIAMKGNPFFVQERAGKKGKPFKLIKYRSMTNKRDKDGNLLPNEQRITKFGKLLRKLSLDELPQIFNIFFGQMSIVGPRPLHMKYNERYNYVQKKRLDVRPGLTGYAQVHGRNAVSWEEKFDKDVFYVDNLSFRLDVKIFFDTIISVLKKQGIDKEGQVGTEEFLGTRPNIELKEVSLEDLEVMLKWRNDENVFRYLGGGYHPIDADKMREILNAMIKENDLNTAKRYIICYNDVKVGFIGLYCLDSADHVAELGVYLGEQEYRGRGVATQACLQLEDIARTYGIKKIRLKVVSENIAAVKMYNSLGYIKTIFSFSAQARAIRWSDISRRRSQDKARSLPPIAKISRLRYMMPTSVISCRA